MNANMPAVRLIAHDRGVLELQFAEDVVVTRALAQEASDLVRSARDQGAEGLVLVDLTRIGGADPDARKVRPANQDGRVAIVLDSFFIQMLSNLFIERNRDDVQRRVFRNRDLAIDWLLDE